MTDCVQNTEIPIDSVNLNDEDMQLLYKVRFGHYAVVSKSLLHTLLGSLNVHIAMAKMLATNGNDDDKAQYESLLRTRERWQEEVLG